MFLCTLGLIIALISFSSTASAQITNGNFSAGGTGWGLVIPLGWTNSFLPDEGNPGGYAAFQSPPTASQGQSYLTQTFSTLTDTPDSCLLAFDFKLVNLGADALSARVICSLNGDVFYTSPSAGSEGIPWTTVTLTGPCGDVDLVLKMEVDAGNNAWQVCLDNVMAEVVDPVVPTTWSRIKAVYRERP